MKRFSLYLPIAVFVLALLVIASGAVFGEPPDPCRSRCVSIDDAGIAYHCPSRAHRHVGDEVGCGIDTDFARPRRVGIPARPRFLAGPFRPWKPQLTATISATSIRLGESVTVVYSTVNATGVMRDITQFRPFIGRCDGTLIPLQGSYTHTPAEVGTFHTNILAARRLLQLNGNGLPDGYRRAVILEFDVEVLPAEAK